MSPDAAAAVLLAAGSSDAYPPPVATAPPVALAAGGLKRSALPTDGPAVELEAVEKAAKRARLAEKAQLEQEHQALRAEFAAVNGLRRRAGF